MLETFGVYVRNIPQPCPKTFLAEVNHPPKECFQNTDNKPNKFVKIFTDIQFHKPPAGNGHYSRQPWRN